MKALLINPNWKDLVSRQGRLINRPWPPLDLLNCAALLESNGIQAEMLDLRAANQPLENVEQSIADADLVFITSTPLDRWQCPNPEIMDFIGFINALGHKDRIIIMGVHGTLYPTEMLELTGAQTVIKGQPEAAVLAVCQGKAGPGIIGPMPVELDRLPPPAYEKIDLGRYYYELMGKRFALLETARGCPYQCSFCQKTLYGDRLERKSLERVKQEIDLLAQKFGARNIYFFDLEFTLEKARVREICEHIIRQGRKFNWCCQTRADAVDLDLLKLMRRSGCVLIHYGVESGSQRVLNSVKKKISRPRIAEGFALTHQAGIATAGFFMFGFPGESKEEMAETIAFARELDPSYASFHAAIPYPGTELVRGKGGQGMFPDIALSDHPKAIISGLVKKAYLAFYLRPRRIFSALRRPKQLLNQAKLFYNFIK